MGYDFGVPFFAVLGRRSAVPVAVLRGLDLGVYHRVFILYGLVMYLGEKLYGIYLCLHICYPSPGQVHTFSLRRGEEGGIGRNLHT